MVNLSRAMPPLGTRTLIQRLLGATVISAIAVGVLLGQSDIQELKKKAEQGDVVAQFSLGDMYSYGQGVPQDAAEAARWYRRAAEQGNGAAVQFLVGVLYRDGDGVPQDYAEAVKWFRLAAAQGNAYAQSELGNRYRDGDGVPQDYAEAVKWFRLAAAQGNAYGQKGLGTLYNLGQGVPQDYAEAARWYRRAAEQGNWAAQFLLGTMYYDGQGVAQDYVEAYKWLSLAAALSQGDNQKARDGLAKQMTPQQIAEAQRLAREWKPKTWAELRKGLDSKGR